MRLKGRLRVPTILPIITTPFVIGLALILMFDRSGTATALLSNFLGLNTQLTTAQTFNGDRISDVLWQNDNGQPGVLAEVRRPRSDRIPMRVSGLTDARQATIEAGWSSRMPLRPYVALVGHLYEAGAEVRRLGSGALGLAICGGRAKRRLWRTAHEFLGRARRAAAGRGGRRLDLRLPVRRRTA
jgi:hypothetical protein